MLINQSAIDGVIEIENDKFEDNRGLFVKTFHSESFEKLGLNANFRESFYSVSKKGVIRGMHFQLPPHDHAKLVFVTDGEILDVAVDIRNKSPTFGKYYSTHLSSDNANSLYMTKGIAHGFLTLSIKATVFYLASTVHAPDFDTGIRWDSFGFDWGIAYPIMSKRDRSLAPLKELE